jgi:hypothetical protein
MAEKKVIGRPFQKGVSGNPAGRSKDAHTISQLAKAYTEEAIEKLDEIMRTGRPSRRRCVRRRPCSIAVGVRRRSTSAASGIAPQAPSLACAMQVTALLEQRPGVLEA